MSTMTVDIADRTLGRLSEVVGRRLGLYFPSERWADLRRGLDSASREFGFGDSASCADWLLSAPLKKSQVAILANHLTVGETYFFRDRSTLTALEEHVFPKLISMQREGEQRLRIWSAGCCTGEEPYSIAMILDMLIPDITAWDITILAADISTRFLQKAEEGLYRPWSFRETPQSARQRYFRKVGEDLYKIKPAIRRMVTFSNINLAEDIYPSLMNNTNAHHVIVCRNVLMYFRPELADEVVERFSRSLVDDGWLVTSATETAILHDSPLQSVRLPGCTLYRKARQPLEKVLPPLLRAAAGDGVDRQAKAAPLPRPKPAGVSRPKALPPKRVASAAQAERRKTEPLLDSCEKALSCYELGRYEEAIRILEKAISEGGSRASMAAPRCRPMALLARAYANQGDLAKAESCCRQAIAGDKLNPGLRYLLAAVMQEEGNLRGANSALSEAIYLDQKFVLAHFALGNLARQERKSEKSTRHFKHALALLTRMTAKDIVPESEGITAGRLGEIIHSMIDRRTIA